MRWSNRRRVCARVDNGLSADSRVSSAKLQVTIYNLQSGNYKATPSVTPCKLSIVNCQLSESVSLQPPVQRAATEAERLCRLTHVPIEPRHRLLDEEPFDFLEAHILHSRRGIAVDP